jgi:hypothetical protein
MRWLRLLVRWWRHDPVITRMIDEFQESFPGRCLICSYHAYGIREGYVWPWKMVEPHDCIERKA